MRLKSLTLFYSKKKKHDNLADLGLAHPSISLPKHNNSNKNENNNALGYYNVIHLYILT